MRPCGELQGRSTRSFSPHCQEEAKGFQDWDVGSRMSPTSGAA